MSRVSRRFLALVLLGAVAGSLAAEESPSTDRRPQVLDPVALGVGRSVRVAPFEDTSGTTHTQADLSAGGAVVFAFTSPSCPLSRKFAPVLARLCAPLTELGARLVLVDVMGSDSAAEFEAFAAQHQIHAVYAHDPERKIAAQLGAQTTTEVFLVDREGVLRYRGAIDDQYGIGYARDRASANWLLDAVEQLARGQVVGVAATSSPGCALPTAGAPRPSTALTWHKEVSRILSRHCMECHRRGGIAPFALETYEQVTAAAGMLEWVVRERVMPPWFAAPPAPGHASPWANDRTLPAQDRAQLLEWLASDHPRGDPEDAPAPVAWPQSWSIGTPDLVLELPREVEVKAEGRMPYVNLRVPTGLTQDRWVSAWEVLPTARDVVHHVLVFASSPGHEDEARAQERELDGFFAAYVPGNGSATYPSGHAKRLRKDSTLKFQLHYTPNGTATADRTRIGLRFAREPVEHEVRTTGIANVRLAIPPGASNHAERAGIRVPLDAQILAYMPHMHIRGKSFLYELVEPDGARRTLLEVPRYDFNWQLAYRLREPLLVTAGQRIEVTGHFDNGVDNPANPDPSKEVRWGLQSDDEMLIGYLEYYLPGVPAGEEPQGARPSRADRMLETLLERLDRDGDGRILRQECPAALHPAFDRLDRDADGVVTAEELKALSGLLPR